MGDVMDKLSKFQKDWDKAMKAAMKKPKEPEVKKDKKKGSNSTDNSTDAKEEPPKEELPTDYKAAEEMLKAVRDKKQAAVENEDFDAANLLKQREVELKTHLDTLTKSEL